LRRSGFVTRAAFFDYAAIERDAIFSAIHSSTSDRTNATRFPVSFTGWGKFPLARSRLIECLLNFVRSQTSFMSINAGEGMFFTHIIVAEQCEHTRTGIEVKQPQIAPTLSRPEETAIENAN